jgi:hypothetical protein
MKERLTFSHLIQYDISDMIFIVKKMDKLVVYFDEISKSYRLERYINVVIQEL